MEHELRMLTTELLMLTIITYFEIYIIFYRNFSIMWTCSDISLSWLLPVGSSCAQILRPSPYQKPSSASPQRFTAHFLKKDFRTCSSDALSSISFCWHWPRLRYPRDYYYANVLKPSDTNWPSSDRASVTLPLLCAVLLKNFSRQNNGIRSFLHYRKSKMNWKSLFSTYSAYLLDNCNSSEKIKK